MKVIPVAVGAILIVASLAELLNSISSVSNGSLAGAGGFSLGLALGFMVGIGLVAYGFIEGGSSVPAEVGEREKQP